MKASTKFRKLIRIAAESENKIAKDLWGLLNKRSIEFVNSIGYLDFAIEDPSRVSYITEDRKDRFYHDKWYYVKSDTWRWERVKKTLFSPFSKRLRHKYAFMTSAGKIIRKLGINASDVEIQTFFSYCFSSTEVLKNLKFKEVSGGEIAHYYHHSTYYDRSKGSLGNSCMKNMDNSVFDIYVYNPNCKLIILVDNKGYIHGRALLWKCVDYYLGEIMFMDRIYVNDYNNEGLFKSYAKRKGYYHKAEQTYGYSRMVSPNGVFLEHDLEMDVDSVCEDSQCPYMDTFRYIDTDLTKLSSRAMSSQIELTSTSGDSIIRYFDVAKVFSEYYDEDIPEDEAVNSEYLNSYIYSRNSVTMHYYNGARERTSEMPNDYSQLIYINGEYWHDDFVFTCNECGEYYIATREQACCDTCKLAFEQSKRELEQVTE